MTNKAKIYIPVIIAIVTIVAVAASPAIMAYPGMKDNHRGHMDIPDLEFSENSIAVSEAHFDALNQVGDISTVIGTLDGQVVQISLKPIQGHVVYFATVVSDGSLYHVIVDAGTGDVLYTSEGKSLEELEAKMAEMKAKHEEMKAKMESGDYEGMKGYWKKDGMTGDYHKGEWSHKGLGDGDRAAKMEKKFSELNADPELTAQFIEKFKALKQAHSNGDSELASELKSELKELRNQIHDANNI